jgi:hypothetical protein
MARRTETRVKSKTGPTPDDVARRACELYEARGGEPGADLDDRFVQNENVVRLPMEPTAKRPELPARKTRRTAHVTSTPDTPAPQLFCPACDRPLVYRQTVIGGVKPLERWDYFECGACGPFVYRDRTRALRRA